MHVEHLPLKGLILITPVVHRDNRGYFLESYARDRYLAAGIDVEFVQDNHSYSAFGTVRGMHFQIPSAQGPGQAKLIRCAKGRIWDVAVDIRPQSPTFGQHYGIFLDDILHQQLYVPIGFAHGFCVMSDTADVTYKVSSLYHPQTEKGFRYNDTDIAIPWPLPAEQHVVSNRDTQAMLWRDIQSVLQPPFSP